MIHFLPHGADPGGALLHSHSAVLVVVSYLVAALASYAGLLTSLCIASAESARGRWGWLAGGSFAMGIGIWAMHFTGMLALTLPARVSYDIPITAMSAVPAIVASALALRVMSGGGNHHRRYLVGGTLLGAGIGAMHYIGMAAMRLDAVQLYDPELFALSLVVAVALGIAAFYARDLPHELRYLNGERSRILFSAALMGLAIAGMHYTAMAAVFYYPAPAGIPSGSTVAVLWLSIVVIAVAVTIMLLAIAATVVSRVFQATARRVRVDRERILNAIETISDGFALFDDQGRLTICNRVLQEMYPALAKSLAPGAQYKDFITAWAGSRGQLPGDVSPEAFVARKLQDFKEGRHMGEPIEDRLGDGRWTYIREHSIDRGGLVAVLTDVTLIKELQAVYEKLAIQDTLTGLASRRLFEDRVDHAIAHARRLARTLPLLNIDLDGFKPINDCWGHDAGDAVLKEVALRLRKAARASDTVARIGGDEFAVLMEPHGDRPGAEALAARIIDAVSRPIALSGGECHVRASIGIAILPVQSVDKETLVKAADEAMYEAKRAGGSTYRVHELLPADLSVRAATP